YSPTISGPITCSLAHTRWGITANFAGLSWWSARLTSVGVAPELQQARQEPRRPTQRHFKRFSLTMVGLGALAVTAFLIWMGPAEPARERPIVAGVPTSAKMKGYLNAPVLIEEWGDFQ